MFLFVVTLDIPGALANPRDRFGWTLFIREMTFAGGGWILAGSAMREQDRGQFQRTLITVGRVLIAIAAIFYGVEHFLHPLGRPGVPLAKLMPVDSGAPARWLSDGRNSSALPGRAILLGQEHAYGGNLSRHLDCAAGLVHLWADSDRRSLADPSTGVQIEGINYFADTLLFGGAILALASATPRTD